MATARRFLVDPSSSGVYHCTSRCVRRAFLCGYDEHSGQNYEHRRGWIQDPVRAKMAATPEESDFTSAQDRAVALRARRQLERVRHEPNQEPTAEQLALITRARAKARRDRWLARIGPAPGFDSTAPPDQNHGNQGNAALPATPPHSSASPPAVPPPVGAVDLPATALDPPALLAHLSAERYLELLDWTGCQIRSGKRGYIDPKLRPLLERVRQRLRPSGCSPPNDALVIARP